MDMQSYSVGQNVIYMAMSSNPLHQLIHTSPASINYFFLPLYKYADREYVSHTSQFSFTFTGNLSQCMTTLHAVPSSFLSLISTFSTTSFSLTATPLPTPFVYFLPMSLWSTLLVAIHCLCVARGRHPHAPAFTSALADLSRDNPHNHFSALTHIPTQYFLHPYSSSLSTHPVFFPAHLDPEARMAAGGLGFGVILCNMLDQNSYNVSFEFMNSAMKIFDL